MKNNEEKVEGYVCPVTKVQCDDECCVSAEDCHIKAGEKVIKEKATMTNNKQSMGDMQFNGTPDEWEALVKKNKIANNKQSMKLYTEEEIRKRLNSPMDDEVTIDEFIESLTPIELRSDDYINEYANDNIESISFVNGAIWMRDLIQGGNK